MTCRVLLIVGLLSAPGSVVTSRDRVSAEQSCTGLRTKAASISAASLNITGTWLSPRCEMTAGPQFLLRKYDFHESGNFKAVKYYFSDEECGEPAYALYFAGRVQLEGASWFVDESYDMSHSVDHVVLMAYTQAAADIIYELIPPQCRRRLGSAIAPNKPVSLKKSLVLDDGHLACSGSLDVSMSELMIMRQTSYYSAEGEGGNLIDRELQLGKTDADDRRRPTSLQSPIKAAEVSSELCVTCKCVLSSSLHRPPRRCRQQPKKRYDLRRMRGRWYSQACESHSTGLFALKALSFDGGHFRVDTRYFTDAFCTVEQFQVTASGTYRVAEEHSRLHSAAIFEFSYAKVTATSQSAAMTETLNMGSADGCATSGPWLLGKEQDVTSSRGCATLGVSLSQIEYAVLKVELWEAGKHVLYISDSKNIMWRATDVILFSENALQQCQSTPINWTPSSGAAAATAQGDGSQSASKGERRRYLVILAGFILTLY